MHITHATGTKVAHTYEHTQEYTKIIDFAIFPYFPRWGSRPGVLVGAPWSHLGDPWFHRMPRAQLKQNAGGIFQEFLGFIEDSIGFSKQIYENS